MRPILAATLVLLVAGSTVPPTAAETSRVEAVTSDPLYEAWIEALRQADARLQEAHAGAPSEPGCGATKLVQEVALFKHEARMRLLESLEKRGVQPGPPDDAVSAWPWGPGIGRPLELENETGNTAVLVDDGYIVYTNLRAQPEVDAVLAARAFYRSFDDEYDFVTLFTNFPSDLFDGRFLAYNISVSNKIEGIGYRHWFGQEEIDIGPTFTLDDTRPTFLKSFIHLNELALYPDNPLEPFCPFEVCRGYTYPGFIGHELGHRWGARILLCPQRGELTALLGRSEVHWSFFLDTDASVLEGNRWDGVEPFFSTSEANARYGALDLYLMGMIPLSEVPESDLFFLQNTSNFLPTTDLRGDLFNPTSPPQAGVSCEAAQISFSHACIEEINGVRRPAYPDTRRDFKAATILVTLPTKPVTTGELEKLDSIRGAVADWFHDNTRQRGTLDWTLRAVPAEVLFTHRPHGDVEDPAQPIEITSEVGLRQRSLATTLDDIRVSLHYSLDGSAFVEVPMEILPGTTESGPPRVRAAIPPQPDGTEVRYYMRSSTALSEHEYTSPRGAPANTHAFSVRPDTQPPRITHVPVTSHSRNAEPAILRAVCLDDHGVDEVQVEYRLNGGATQTLRLAVQGVSDVYESRFVPPGDVGDTVEYRIVARDAARTPHVAVLPSSGWFELDVTLIQFQNAEKEDPLWTHRSLRPFGVDEWHRQLIHNVTPIGKYSWKAGPDNLETNPRLGETAYEQDAVLEGPAVRLGEGWELRFWHRFYLRTAPAFTDRSAIDGAVIQWQDAGNPKHVKDDRWFLIDPVGGYNNQLGAYAFFNPLQWWPCWSGEQDFFGRVRVDSSIRPDFAGRLIRFRFRLVTSVPVDRTERGAGWYVDDIEIDPGTVVPVTLEALQAERTDAGITIAWRAGDADEGDLFHVDRALVDAQRQPGAFEHRVTIAASHDVETYAWTDTDGEARAYAYRVRLVSNGVERVSRQVLVEAVAPRFALHANRPNPFNPRTTIAFELRQEQRARLDIYDVSGRHVSTLVNRRLEPGPHRVNWNGEDESGRAVASGVYLYRLQAGAHIATRRMLLLR